MSLDISVVGTPKPQGSHRAFINQKTGRAHVTDDNPKTKTWKQDVRAAALDALTNRPPMEGPVEVTIAFAMPRPGYHFGRRGGKPYLKPTAPTYVDKKPDIDKLTRSTLDALTEARVFIDDAQVAALNVVKGYATDPQKPGAHITVVPLIDAVPTGAERVDQVLTSEQGVLL